MEKSKTPFVISPFSTKQVIEYWKNPQIIQSTDIGFIYPSGLYTMVAFQLQKHA